MGLLDSNIMRVIDKKDGFSTLYEAQSAGTSATLASSNIDCSNYNTLVLRIEFTENSGSIQVAKKVGNNTIAYPYTEVVILGSQERNVDGQEIDLPVGVTYIVVDVSDAKNVGVGKWGTSGILKCQYLLANSEDGMLKLLRNNLDKFIPADFKTKQTIASPHKNTLIISANAPGADNIFTASDAYSHKSIPIYCLELNAYIDFYTKLPSGWYTLIVDIHDNLTVEFQASGSGTIVGRYKLSDDIFNIPSECVNYAYHIHQTTAVGNGRKVVIPNGAKYAIANITVHSGTVRIPFTAWKNSIIGDCSISESLNDKGVVIETLSKNSSNYYSIGTHHVLFDLTNIAAVSCAIEAVTDTSVSWSFYYSEIAPQFRNVLYPDNNNNTDVIESAGFKKLFGSNSVDVYMWNNSATRLCAVRNNLWVWCSETAIYISENGISGEKTAIVLNSTNFPNILSNSKVAKVVIVPWARNVAGSYNGWDSRINVITSRGQVYHNFPSRSESGDGNPVDGDLYRFDESVLWELPERWSPVKTQSGSDAELIATGKYRYFPCLPNQSYEMHPAISTDNGYGNGGFPATITKRNNGGVDVTFGRFWNPDNTIAQCNSMDYMGGFAPHPKLTLIGTYRSNTYDSGTRICVFITNDGGRQWFCRYEFGANGALVDANGATLASSGEGTWRGNVVFNGATVSSGKFTVKSRKSVIPSASNKEPSDKFAYSSAIAISSISCDGTQTLVTTSTNHGIKNGEVVVFAKSDESVTDWDWIDNSGATAQSAGNGVIFLAKYVNDTSFYLMVCVHNPYNNIACRHIHSVDRCKNGYTISTGERYPQGGWIYFLECKEGDTFDKKMPWDILNFIRLNSTSTSVYRSLGCIVNDDGSMIVGIDDSMINSGSIALPEGRTGSIPKASQGVYKGSVELIDSLSSWDNILETSDVAYMLKKVENIFIYMGQTGKLAISFDGGTTWIESNLPLEKIESNFYHYGGISQERFIVCDNVLIIPKQ